jgi:outer membrane protein TolC
LKVTERSTEVARGRLRAGIGDAFEVVRSQDDVSNATLQVIDAAKVVELSKIQLARALGTLK